MAIQSFDLERKMGIVRYGNLQELTLGKNITGDKLNRFLFNADTPTHMGMKVTRIFTSMSRFYPKFFTGATIGSATKNYCMIDSPHYTWDMQGDVDTFIRISKDVDAISENSGLIVDGLIGQGQKEFYIQLDSNQVSQNSVLLLDNNNFSLLVTNDGIQEGINTRYSVRIQGSDEMYGIPIDWLKQDRFVTDNSTSLPEFGNPAKPGIGRMGTTIRLKNVVGKYGRSFTLDENAVRMAMKANKDKMTAMPSNSNAVGGKWDFSPTDMVNGAVFAFPVIDKNTRTGELSRLKPEGFISYLEMKIEDLLDQDREAMCHFGHAMNFQTTISTTNVNSANTAWFVAAGLRDLLKLGHYKTHNGQIDTDMLQEYLHSIYMTRVDEIDRRTVFVSGELGKTFLHTMVNTAAQGFFSSAKGDQFIAPAESSTKLRNALRFGYQFTQWIGLNGIEVTFAYNKMFDDKHYCRQPYTPNSSFCVDSARMEIYDFGNTTAASKDAMTSETNAGYGGHQNVSMICQEDQDIRHWRIGMLHPYKGWQNVSETNDTTSTYSRTKGGSPVIWDTTRCGAIVYVPLA